MLLAVVLLMVAARMVAMAMVERAAAATDQAEWAARAVDAGAR